MQSRHTLSVADTARHVQNADNYVAFLLPPCVHTADFYELPDLYTCDAMCSRVVLDVLQCVALLICDMTHVCPYQFTRS